MAKLKDKFGSSQNSYFEWLKSDFVAAVKEWRKHYKTLNSQQLRVSNDIAMQHAGKRAWDRPHQSYEIQILELIQGEKDIEILDAGCGVGFMLYQLHERGFECLEGVDSSPICINECLKRSSENKVTDITWKVASIEYSGYRNNIFDVIICCEVLEHVIEPLKIINELYRMLKPVGVLLCSVPHQERRTSFMHINYFYLKTSMPKEWPPKEYNLYEASDLLELSKLKNITVGLDKREKFIIMRGIK